jgi:POT family proton-dependent oligopeptide transporter
LGGSILLGLSFIVMIVGAKVVGTDKGSAFWPLFCTLLLTVGELYLSPIGLSLVTKVSPARIVSAMMGMWFLSSFFGNIASGYIGALYEGKTLSAVEFFSLLTFLGVATGLAMWAFSNPLKKAMAGATTDTPDGQEEGAEQGPEGAALVGADDLGADDHDDEGQAQEDGAAQSSSQ